MGESAGYERMSAEVKLQEGEPPVDIQELLDKCRREVRMGMGISPHILKQGKRGSNKEIESCRI